ncbi:MAG: hypothetical protein IJW63_07105 [Lachnospiraceae bacterium]|nr:hypothetical protein [Lachnospiraceae bacterium]
MWQKIKDMHMEKKRSFRMLLIMELCLLVAGVIGLFGKDDVYYFDSHEMVSSVGGYSQEKEGYFLDESCGAVSGAVKLGGISLPRGVYTVSLYYETDTFMGNMCNMTDLAPQYKTFLCNGEHLYEGLGVTDFQVWVLKDKENLALTVDYGGTGYLLVQGLEIAQSNALSRIFLFCVILGALSVNACYVYVMYDKTYVIDRKDKNILAGLVLVIAFASLPLMVDGMQSNADLVFHLMRVAGIKDGLQMGQFPLRIAPEWQQGYGYACSIFYGDTLLYIAGFLRWLGFSLITSYRLFVLIVNGMTVLIAYYCFQKMFRDKYVGLMCSAVYTLSIYRVAKLYVNGAFGEACANVFLPLIVYGFYRVFTEDIEDKKYGRAWIPLTIGFAGLVQSHLLTGELTGLFTILLCLAMWKKVFRARTFTVLAKTVIYSVLSSLWFLVPFVDYMLRGDFVIQNVAEREIQYRGVQLAQLFSVFFNRGNNVFYYNNGLSDAQPSGIGIALWLPLVVFVGILYFRKTKGLSSKDLKVGKIAAAFGGLAMCMTLLAFPWDKIQFLSSISKTLVSSLQFPNRFLIIASVCLTVVCGVVMKWAMNTWGQKGLVTCVAGIVALLLVSTVYLMNDMVYNNSGYLVYDEECIGSGYVAGGEYLPYGTDASQLMYGKLNYDEGIEIADYSKTGLNIDLTCRNLGQQDGRIELPLLYYWGYKAQDAVTGEEMQVFKGTNNVVSVVVPSGYEGQLKVGFESPWYWRMAELVSVLVVLGLGVSVYIQKRKEMSGHEA